MMNIKDSGFSLIEMCFVLIIWGLILSSSLSLIRIPTELNKATETKEKLKAAQNAIRSYYYKNNHYPCPADPAVSYNSLGFGKSSTLCKGGDIALSLNTKITKTQDKDKSAVYIGLLPFRSLGISDIDGVDAWGNVFLYAISADLTKVESFSQHSGSIEILSENRESRLTPTSSAQYAILSMGSNMSGGYKYQSNLYTPCHVDSLVLESENCNNDNTFVDSISYSENSEFGIFDDLIVYTSYDLEIDSSGGVHFLFENGCPSAFHEVDLEDPDRINGLLAVRGLDNFNNKKNKSLCFSSKYNRSILVDNNKDLLDACPKSWEAIGKTSGHYDEGSAYIVCVF